MFQSVSPSVVKSIKQKDMLNTWLRLYATEQQIPQIADFQPERMSDEIPDLALFMVDHSATPPRLIFERESQRMAAALGHSSNGRPLDEYLGPPMAAIVMPIYHECIRRALPAYTIFNFQDAQGRKVSYERMLLPFSGGGRVSHIVSSNKSISEDGSFQINNLIRDSMPVPQLLSIIDRDLFHRMPGRVNAQDIAFE